MFSEMRASLGRLFNKDKASDQSKIEESAKRQTGVTRRKVIGAADFDMGNLASKAEFGQQAGKSAQSERVKPDIRAPEAVESGKNLLTEQQIASDIQEQGISDIESFLEYVRTWQPDQGIQSKDTVHKRDELIGRIEKYLNNNNPLELPSGAGFRKTVEVMKARSDLLKVRPGLEKAA